ncbi:hypothetical protein [Rummeliibacillus pycnus]|uniref:hypothetical protein n=1 Tax=Rummeliibacillus pycnus TaxID=101070 RepID=UPI001475C4A7|nr:hypothetical protein [Rummeliibacillus pycnus]
MQVFHVLIAEQVTLRNVFDEFSVDAEHTFLMGGIMSKSSAIDVIQINSSF